MRPEDRAYLWDMREAVTEIANVVTTMGAQEFEEARLVRFGVERLVIILGEAAACVSEEARAENRSISWRQIQRLRSRLRHSFGGGSHSHTRVQCAALRPVSKGCLESPATKVLGSARCLWARAGCTTLRVRADLAISGWPKSHRPVRYANRSAWQP